MSVQDTIKRQEANKLKLNSIGKPTPRKKSVSTRQQVKNAKQQQGAELLAILHDGKRAIPSDWERGYNAAMGLVAQALLDSKDAK